VLQKLWAEQIRFLNFSDDITNVFVGLNVNLLGFNDFSYLQILLKILDPFTSLVISDISFRFLGFFGTIRLLTMLTNLDKRNHYIIYLFAVIFALFPTIPSYTPTFQTFPIITFLAIKIFKNPINVLNIIFFFIVSQNVSFIYGGFAFYLVLFVVIIVFLFKKRISIKKFLGLHSILILTVVFTNMRILQELVLKHTLTQRSEWTRETLPFKSEFLSLPVKLIRSLFIIDSNSGYTIFSPFILLFALLAYGLNKYYRLITLQKSPIMGHKNYLYLYLFLIISFFILIFNLSFLGVIVTKFTTFQLNRGYIFNTFILVFFIFTLLIKLIASKVLQVKVASYVIVISLVIGIFSFYPIRAKIENTVINISLQSQSLLDGEKNIYNVMLGKDYSLHDFSNKLISRKVSTLEDYYYLESSFNDSNYNRIKNNETILTIGINPMVLAWNGWNVYNGYVFNYPLDHKHDFISIVETKMKYDTNYREYIQNWGNRLTLTLDPSDHSLFGVNLCNAKSLGINYLVSDNLVSGRVNMSYYGNYGRIYIYQIEC
jgi:hypothetical protein